MDRDTKAPADWNRRRRRLSYRLLNYCRPEEEEGELVVEKENAHRGGSGETNDIPYTRAPYIYRLFSLQGRTEFDVVDEKRETRKNAGRNKNKKKKTGAIDGADLIGRLVGRGDIDPFVTIASNAISPRC